MKKLQTFTINDQNVEHLNFIIHYPEWLPVDCIKSNSTLRPEQTPGRPEYCDEQTLGLCPWTKGNSSSLRTLISGTKRQLRIKQFLYDWAPPAAGLPSLWESTGLIPFKTGKEIAWIGTDYKENKAACLQRNKTQIELSILEGEFTNEELKKIIDSIIPVRNLHNQEILKSQFFTLSYWQRYQHEGIKVPHGLLKYNARHFYDFSTLLNYDQLSERGIHIPISIKNYRFDSAVFINNKEKSIVEYELMYYAIENQSDQLWLHFEVSNEVFPLVFPPEADDHLFEINEVINLNNQEVYFAALHAQFGGYEAFWEQGSYKVGLWASCTQFMDYEKFKLLVSELVSGV